MSKELKAQLTLRNATFILSVGLFAMLLNYFFTGPADHAIWPFCWCRSRC
jgi:hypothetical protein